MLAHLTIETRKVGKGGGGEKQGSGGLLLVLVRNAPY
jgi:hypothetical protein